VSGALRVEGLSKRFDGRLALSEVSFEAGRGELFCIVGPTNAGKSTLLKTIAGLHRADAGRIHIGPVEVTELEPKDRGVSLLFQNMALFPTLTGFENIGFALRTAGISERQVRARVEEVAKLLDIDHLLSRHPRTFSGGEQQRVAIGRAIARPADLLMLDEPLTNLDARLRIALRIEFKKLHRETGQTMLYVTHDQVEAMSLSDRVAVLNEGRFEQIGTPDDIYHRPETRFVARFVGMPPMNLLDVELVEEADMPRVRAQGFEMEVPLLKGLADYPRLPRALALGVRAEEIRVAAEPSAEAPFAGEVFWVERLGAKSILDAKLGQATLKAVVAPDHPVQAEGPAWFGFEPKVEHLLDPQSDRFLR